MFFRQFDGFGPQKQFAFSKASHAWILNLDSDELVTPEFQKEVEELLSSDAINKYSAFRINRKLFFLNRPLSFSGTTDLPIRLFNRHRARMSPDIVHEKIVTSGELASIKAPVLHYSYGSLEEYFTKFNRYTSLAAEELYKKEREQILFSPGEDFLLFLRRYIFQLGLLDGYSGFLWCLLSALYSTVKYLKLYEFTQRES